MHINLDMMADGAKLTSGGFILSADSRTILLEAMYELVAKRRRGRLQGVLDGPQGGPNVDFFGTDKGTAAAFYDFHPTEQVVLPPPEEPSDHAFLHFALANATEFYRNGRLLHRFEPQHCTIGFVQTGNKIETRYQADRIHREVCVYMDPALLIGLMQDGEDPDGHASVQADDPFSVVKTLPIDGAQSLLLRELFGQNAYEGAIRDLYRESKLLELICVAVSKLRHGASGPAINLDQKDIAAIHKAKELLLKDIVNPPSLKPLANRAGTNEFKLKKGFKQLFGQTVYGMLHEVRLLEARRLIEQDGMSVHEAAQWVGYKSASHFSGIFKRHFGILPRQLKNNATAVSDV